MLARLTLFNNLFSALLLTLVAAAWVAFAPIRFGGQAAYVIISGISMEPNFHRGDLAILRQADEYAIGDVVTYQHPIIGPVIHRIIARDGEHFVFQGDNNSWIDEYRPTTGELIGKLWIYLPSAGALVEQLRVPRNMAVLVAVMGAIVMTTGTGSVDRSRQRRRFQRSPWLTVRLVLAGRAPTQQARAFPTSGIAANLSEVFFLLAVVVFAALLLGWFAFTRPLTRSVGENIGYEQSGAWSYSAAAPDGLYDSGSAQTGEPIFRRVASSVALHFDYQFASEQPADLNGSVRMFAELGDVSGWKRTIELQPSTIFHGRAAAIDGRLELARIQMLIDSFEQQTGLQHSQYTLDIVPEVHVQGQLAAQALNDDFAPRLQFEIDGQVLRYRKDSATGPNALRPTKPGMLKRDREEPNTLVLLGLRLDVLAARRIALIGLAAALTSGVLLSLRLRGPEQDTESAQIQRTYGPLLVAVLGSDVDLCGPIVELATIADLARLAERGGHMILHQRGHAQSCYLVQDGGVNYRYQPATSAALPEGPLQ